MTGVLSECRNWKLQVISYLNFFKADGEVKTVKGF